MMFRYSFIVILAGALCTSGCKKSGDYTGPLNSFKRYPYQKLHLSYTYDGDLRGTDELYFSDYGKYEARYSKYEVLVPGEVRGSDNASLLRITDRYDINFQDNTVIHDRDNSLDSLYHLDEKDIPASLKYWETDMKNHFLVNKGTDIIDGKPAARWEADGGGLILWVWNSILLRKRVNSNKGSMEMTIKTIDSLWTVDTTKFSIPAGLTNKPKPQPNAPGSN